MGIITQAKLANTGIGKDQLPIVWEGQYYYDIEEFDCHVVRLKSHREGGGYTTVIPISPLEYRKRNPTKAKVIVKTDDDDKYVNFHCYTDYGECNIMSIPKYKIDLIEIAMRAAREQQLLTT